MNNIHKPSGVEMMQTPAGHVKVGDVIGYDRSNKRIRFCKVL